MLRHYINLEKTFGKIDLLMKTFKFKTMSDVLLDTL
jgi:hypothetical protein